MTQQRTRAVGQSLPRLDGPLKVTGRAPYAYEQPVDCPAYMHLVQATVARGRITDIDTSAARRLHGVLFVLTHENSPRLPGEVNPEVWVLQSPEVAYRGQVIGAVVAETPEIAREAAGLVRVTYQAQPHDVELRVDHDGLYAPKSVNVDRPTDRIDGDVTKAVAAAAVTLDEAYTTPMEHHTTMEPHSTVAVWDHGTRRFLLYDSTQGVHSISAMLAEALGISPAQVRVVSPYVGGGFGSKAHIRPHHVVLALAAWLADGRPVRFALTRQQTFVMATYRVPTIQRMRLAADGDGRLTAIAHDVVEQTSRIQEFAEQTAVCSRTMYAAPNRRTTHRLVALDVPVPGWMRAPGETPGMFAAEAAMDEMAIACGLDPIEFRLRNEPAVDPDTGMPFSCRDLAGCLREGARLFGWHRRPVTPGTRRENGYLVGMGVAAATLPALVLTGSVATVHYGVDRCYRVRIAAADIGTGAWTALTQIAADALGCPLADVRLEIGDTDLPTATVAGGSTGINNWGTAIIAAADAFRAEHGSTPALGAQTTAGMPEFPDRARYATHSFGAHFVEVRVDADTGEVRVPRMLGVFSVGRVINPRTARSQLIGGMTMGLSMALFEHSVLDPRFGHVVTRDLAEYHIATHADVMDIEATWLDETDPHVNPLGAKGLGEIGIVGSPAAVANAVYNATAIRVRDLPITPDKLLL